MAAPIIKGGDAAHADEEAAIAFLAEGLPPSATVFSNPMLASPQGALYELDAVVVMPHALFIVEIKSFHGQVRAGLRDWTLNDGRTWRSPLLLGRKTAQVLHSALARRSYDAGRVWVQELTFLPNVTRVDASNPAIGSRIALRDTLHAMLLEPERVNGWANRYIQAKVTPQVESDLIGLFDMKRPTKRVTKLAHYDIEDTLDTLDRYTEYLGKTANGQERILRHYRRPWQTSNERWAAMKKRAVWEAGILASLDRAPPELGLPRVDACIATNDDVIVPMEYFQGLSLPEWMARGGKDLPLDARLALWHRIARSVAYLHERGIIHRHLSAGLVLVAPAITAEPEFRLTGFDLAKRMASDTTIASSGVTTDRLEGSAPEVVHALSDGEPRSDQFSLGLILALLVLGEPLVDSTLSIIEENRRMPRLRERRDNQSERLDTAVAKMLERRPTDRFRTLDDAMTAVTQATEPAVPTHADPLAPGNPIGADYVIVDKLGSGGLSDVYKVKHRLLPQFRAFKIARNNDTAEHALRREHAALSLFDHPQVVKAHDLTKMVADRITLVLDFIDGSTLSDVAPTIAEGDTHTRRRLAEDLFTALDVFEQMDLSHNDLKPDNLMVTTKGRLVTIDLSLADGPSLRDHDKAPLGGTQKWRDPATRRGHAADRYAASMCLFWLHAGRHPFDGTVPEPDTAPDIQPEDFDPPGLVAFFQKALHPEPAERYPSASSLRDGYLTALGAAVPGSDVVSATDLTTSTPLSQTALPSRAVRCLASVRVRTVGHLLSLTDADVRQVHGLGNAMATHLRAFAERARRAGITAQPVDATDAPPPFFAALVTHSSPLSDLPLDPSLLTALARVQLTTVGAVARSTRAELLAIKDVGPKSLTQLGQALVALTAEQDGEAVTLNTVDGVWQAATRDLSSEDTELLAHFIGLKGPGYATQAELAAALGMAQPQVSVAKNRALAGLNRAALEPLIREVHSLLDNKSGIALLTDAAESLVRELPAGALEPAGALALVCELDRVHFALYDDLEPDIPAVLVRPRWFTKDTLRTFLDSARRVASWPPTSEVSAKASLKMVLPEYQANPVTLASRLIADVCITSKGGVYAPPVRLADATDYALTRETTGIALDTLQARLDAVFGDRAPIVPDAVALADALDSATNPTCPFTVVGNQLVRRDGPKPTPDPLTTANVKGVLAVSEHESEDQVVTRRLLGATQTGAAFRLVVAAPAHDVAIGLSLVDALAPHTEVIGVDLANEWFERHSGDLSRDSRAHRLAPLRKITAANMNRLFDDIVAKYADPHRTIVLYRTGLLHTLGALEEVRLLYTRVSGGGKGLWVLVIPGTVNDVSTGQPLFNGVHETWRLPGQVLPLNHPIAPAATPGNETP